MALPEQYYSAYPIVDSDGYCPNHEAGLTKREYAAIHIFAGLKSRPGSKSYAATAVELADELFKELDK